MAVKGRNILTCGLIFLFAVCSCTGCGRSQTDRPDLSALGEIHVIAREDGSGTRTQFEDLTETKESGADQTASSTEEVVETVESDPSAIGYAAMSAVPDDAGVTIIAIDDVQPSVDTVRSQKYPLTRSFYLAWVGDLSDLGQEFLTYIQGAGQKIVAQEAVPVSKETSFLSMKPTGSLKVSGSTSMTPLIEKLAKEYGTYNPNAEIEVTESDSSTGLTDAMQGKADLAMSSRDLKDYEEEILSYQRIAADGIVIIVNKENKLTGLSMSELKEIYDGTVEEWGDLN